MTEESKKQDKRRKIKGRKQKIKNTDAREQREVVRDRTRDEYHGWREEYALSAHFEQRALAPVQRGQRSILNE